MYIYSIFLTFTVSTTFAFPAQTVSPGKEDVMASTSAIAMASSAASNTRTSTGTGICIHTIRTLQELLSPSPTSIPTTISTSMSTPQNPLLSQALSLTIPPLTPSSHKGSSGRIAILGGSEKYTGAPYYAAMSALRTGADLSSVFCAKEAMGPIKGYSPELMVEGVYSAESLNNNNISALTLESQDKNSANACDGKIQMERMVQTVTESLDRMHSLVIGPGLGRDLQVLDAVAKIIRRAKEKGVSMVLDADALFLLSLDPYHDLILDIASDSNSSASAAGVGPEADVHASASASATLSSNSAKIVLTPNIVEYKRLVDSIANGSEERWREILSGSSTDVVVVKKGHHDVIEYFPARQSQAGSKSDKSDGDSDGNGNTHKVMICAEKGGLKRSGGIGDILAGSIGVFLAWNRILSGRDKGMETDLLLSVWMACSLTKRATRVAFEKRKRSMTAPDILEEIGDVVDEVTSSTILKDDEE